MKNFIFIIVVFFSLSTTSQVQELGFFTGTGYYLGDLNRSHFSQQDLCVGAVYKSDFRNERMSLRFHLMYNKVRASDDVSGINNQIYRNLSFKSEIIEFGPVIEIDFFPFHPGQNHTDEPDFGSPYFLIGLNYMRMNPKTKIGDSTYQLQPLMTEGQEKPYSLNQIVIPLGIGIKMNITHHLSLSFEYGIRKTFTDFLDDVSGLYADPVMVQSPSGSEINISDRSPDNYDVRYGSQRGNSSDKDWYAVSGIILTYEFFKDVVCPKW